MAISFAPQELFSLLFHGTKAVDVLQAALELGILRRLDEGPVTVAQLSQDLELIPERLVKFMDCLEGLGLVRQEPEETLEDTRYVSIEPLHDAATIIVGSQSVERERDHFNWESLQGRLPEVLQGKHQVPIRSFDWPPRNPQQIKMFEATMAQGLDPIEAGLIKARDRLWPPPPEGQAVRILDIGGGDGSLAQRLVTKESHLWVDIYNLPETRFLVESKVEKHSDHLEFVAGDFLKEELPSGYDVLLLVRVLMDWPDPIAKELLKKAMDAVVPGGWVVICEPFRKPAPLARQLFWNYFLMGVDGCSSRLRDTQNYHRMLSQTGFQKIEVLAGEPPFDLIIARRP